MHFRDLREDVEKIPTFNSSVFVRGDISLDRAYCLNEVEAELFLRNRLQELTPLQVSKIKVSHKDRQQGASIWEAEFTLTGPTQSAKPVPRTELKALVQNLVQRAGFGVNTDVEVRGMTSTGAGGEESNAEPDEREMQAKTAAVLRDRIPTSKPAPRSEVARLEKGDKVTVSRSGFMESGEVVDIDLNDDSLELAIVSENSTVWVPFRRIYAIQPKK
jgi:transcription antitermination factor NusG